MRSAQDIAMPGPRTNCERFKFKRGVRPRLQISRQAVQVHPPKQGQHVGHQARRGEHLNSRETRDFINMKKKCLFFDLIYEN